MPHKPATKRMLAKTSTKRSTYTIMRYTDAYCAPASTMASATRAPKKRHTSTPGDKSRECAYLVHKAFYGTIHGGQHDYDYDYDVKCTHISL